VVLAHQQIANANPSTSSAPLVSHVPSPTADSARQRL